MSTVVRDTAPPARTGVSGWLAGPELYWIAAYVLSGLLVALNDPPTDRGNLVLEASCWLLALIGVPLMYWLFHRRAARPRQWLGLRMKLATFFGLNAALFALIDGIDYGDSRNSGVLGFWMIGLIFGGLAYLVCSGVRRLVRRRHLQQG